MNRRCPDLDIQDTVDVFVVNREYHYRLQDVCRKWEHSRGPIGAQWVWLRHRITKINRQLSQLDATVQQRPKREQFFLSPPTSRTLSHPSNIWGGGGGGKTVNGSNHVTSFPHLFLPDGILTNGPIQVSLILEPVSDLECSLIT